MNPLVSQFIAQAEGARATVQTLKTQINAIVRDIPALPEMDAVQLRSYFRQLTLSPATVNARIWAARQFFTWAHAANIVAENPMEYVKSLKITREMDVKRLAPTEVEYLLLASRKHVRDNAIIRFMLDTAARVAEVTSVTVDDFKKAVYSGKIVLHGKGGYDEYVSFANPETIKAVKAYLRTRSDDSPYLFVSRLSARITPRAIQHLVKKHMLQANARYHGKCNIAQELMHPHTLRHTAIDEFYRHSRDAVATMRYGRHKSFSSTLVYVNAQDFNQQDAVISQAPWNQ